MAVPLHFPGRPLAIMVAGPMFRIGPRYAEISQLLGQQLRGAEKEMSTDLTRRTP